MLLFTVYLKGLFARRTTTALLFIAIIASVECGPTKIAYKKPIYGKTNIIKEKRIKAKVEEPKTTTYKANVITATKLSTEQLEVTTLPYAVATNLTTATAHIQTVPNLEATGPTLTTEAPSSTAVVDTTEQRGTTEQIGITTQKEMPAITTAKHFFGSQNQDSVQSLEKTSESAATASSTSRTSTSTSTSTTENNRIVPCTCGIFLSSQIKQGSSEKPTGKPAISNELDRNYPCNAIGQKQCQTKCLENIVKHLPNSAAILCASLDRDIRKERAYLYVKNCNNNWWNTTLAAGREYCCKNGTPYTCPMV
ncbi:follicle cell protein 3C-1 [Teleopsis dalmanni]|uniref:follicle cell protein 3C-1 n=1 Tax=Teleopsis dalmanni TaxID=139649 RepID=UPI0018CD11C0|nr:follicle cell protein 3C-1 [Teleopsis dalmanni]